jgi:glutamyl-tRNA reductase
VAVHLAVSVFGDLSDARIVVIGAGEMAKLAIDAMRKRGARSIVVVNRTLERARLVASRWSAVALPFESLPAILRQADIVLSSTGSADTILHVETLTTATAGRSGRPLLLLDIAVPRDIDPEVGQLPGVRLYNIDQLVEAVDATLGERQREIPRAERLIEEEVASFQAWFDGLARQALIAALHRKAESIRERELARSLRRLPNLTSREHAHLEAFSRSLVRKLLHDPIMSLRAQSLDSSTSTYTEDFRELFALPAHPSLPGKDTPADGNLG